jgi:hypothetical protein
MNESAPDPKNLLADRGYDSSPCLERFAPEDAERVAGCQVALDVETLVDGGVNRREPLR